MKQILFSLMCKHYKHMVKHVFAAQRLEKTGRDKAWLWLAAPLQPYWSNSSAELSPVTLTTYTYAQTV